MPDVSTLLGPYLLGACLNLILYGVCVLQTFLYFQTYSRDPLRIRMLVAYLFIMETINTVCIIGLLYEPMVLNYGDPVSFQKAPLMLIVDAILTVLISTPAQIFVAWRLKIVSGNAVIPVVISLLAIVSLAGGTKLSASVAMNREYMHFNTFKPTVIVWLASSAVADFFITSALTWSLFTRKSAVKATDDKVARILRLTIQTGFVTMVFAVVDLGLFVAHSNTTLNFIPDFALSKLYTNSLLSTLNARAGWNTLGQATHEVNVLFQRSELSAMQKQQIGVESGQAYRHGRAGSVFVARSHPGMPDTSLLSVYLATMLTYRCSTHFFVVGGLRLSFLVGFSAKFSSFGRFEFPTALWLGAGVAADLCITIGLFISLSTRKTSINKETDDKVARIIKLTIQTGALTMIFATADLVLFLTSHTSLNFIPDFALSKLFTNSLLCTLNARGGWDRATGEYQDNALFGRSEISDVRKQHVETLPSRRHVVEEETPAHELHFSINENPVDSMELQVQEPAHYGGLAMQKPTPPFRAGRSYESSPRTSSDQRDGSSEDIRWKRVGDKTYF
ncbi:hypothetical protein D9619_012891 [Psilocybe cf. subviscida]|uniref:DUF6534 domain-containing protein n=1 Tax=Psilocybe cf. subviscida TaxID=2480587 RepID=A0A8H5BIL9_9AGAR|nr:hypothetical protein D9619_012891 [Psilocybe cf. subviscida]